MLTKMEAIHPRFPTVPFVFDMATIRTDPFQIRNIDGLGPVAATVASDPYSGFDGEQVTGMSVGKRNIVFTLGFNPNYSDLDLDTPAKLRQEAYKYFMPKQKLTFRLTFSHISNPCLIEGIVETVEPNIFSQDPEMTVSVLCHMPYFVEDDEIVVGFQSLSMYGTSSQEITYEGTVPTGFTVRFYKGGASNDLVNSDIRIACENLGELNSVSEMYLDNVYVDSNNSVYFNTNFGEKEIYQQQVSPSLKINRLSKLRDDSEWLTLKPGLNKFRFGSDTVAQNVEIVYKNLYGGF